MTKKKQLKQPTFRADITALHQGRTRIQNLYRKHEHKAVYVNYRPSKAYAQNVNNRPSKAYARNVNYRPSKAYMLKIISQVASLEYYRAKKAMSVLSDVLLTTDRPADLKEEVICKLVIHEDNRPLSKLT